MGRIDWLWLGSRVDRLRLNSRCVDWLRLGSRIDRLGLRVMVDSVVMHFVVNMHCLFFRLVNFNSIYYIRWSVNLDGFDMLDDFLSRLVHLVTVYCSDHSLRMMLGMSYRAMG